MIANTLKLVALAGLVFVSAGAWPNRRTGTAIAIGLWIAVAVTLRFVAP